MLLNTYNMQDSPSTAELSYLKCQKYQGSETQYLEDVALQQDFSLLSFSQLCSFM